MAAGLLGQDSSPRKDRHVPVAMILASLVAGIMFVINCDRITNVQAAREIGYGVSLHGWPFVYLKRSYETPVARLISTHSQDWPFQPVPGEIREFNYPHMLYNILIAAGITLVSYFFVRWAVFRYDRWKETWNQPAAVSSDG